MKDKMKNTLEHEIELLGRSVSVLLIAGLLVVGGASAALLTSFGTVTGTADVDQSVLVNDQPLDSGSSAVQLFDATSNGDGALVAGESTTGTTTVENRADSPVSSDFTTTGDYTEEGVSYEYSLLDTYTETEGSTSTRANVIWDGNSFAVDAKADASGGVGSQYETPAEYAGVTFHLDTVQTVDLDTDTGYLNVDYRVGEDHTYPDGSENDQKNPDTVALEMSNADYTVDGSTYDDVVVIDAAVVAESDTNTELSEPSTFVFESDGETLLTGPSSGAATDFSEFSDSADVEKVTVSTGTSSSGSSEDDVYHLIYEEVEFGTATGLISERTYVPSSSSNSESISLQPNTDYDFAGYLGTDVYLEPNTGYAVSTELSTGQ